MKTWMPKLGQVYWFVLHDLSIESRHYTDTYADRMNVELGNCFESESDAKGGRIEQRT